MRRCPPPGPAPPDAVVEQQALSPRRCRLSVQDEEPSGGGGGGAGGRGGRKAEKEKKSVTDLVGMWERRSSPSRRPRTPGAAPRPSSAERPRLQALESEVRRFKSTG